MKKKATIPFPLSLFLAHSASSFCRQCPCWRSLLLSLLMHICLVSPAISHQNAMIKASVGGCRRRGSGCTSSFSCCCSFGWANKGATWQIALLIFIFKPELSLRVSCPLSPPCAVGRHLASGNPWRICALSCPLTPCLPCCAHSKSLLRVSHFFKCRRQWPSYPEKNQNKIKKKELAAASGKICCKMHFHLKLLPKLSCPGKCIWKNNANTNNCSTCCLIYGLTLASPLTTTPSPFSLSLPPSLWGKYFCCLISIHC